MPLPFLSLAVARRLAPSITAAIVVLSLLAGCAAMAPPRPGQTVDAVVAHWGPPTGRHALPEGGERLEYATGPYGRTTWMVDLDRAGRVQATQQVLNEAHFADFATRVAGLTPAEVRRELGRPGERRQLGWLGGELWSWRYPTNDCLWYQVSFDDAGRALAAGYNNDPACDKPSPRE